MQNHSHILVTTPEGHTETIFIQNHPVPLTLAQCVYTSGFFSAPALCSGLGACGRCRMRITHNAPLPNGPDALYFTEEELRDGWRLACGHSPLPGMHVLLPESAAQPRRLLPPPALSAQSSPLPPLRLAVDLGTTSLHWSLLAGTTRLASGSELNPQMGAGSEIMSRLAFAARPEGAAVLQRLVLKALQALVHEAETTFGSPVQECCIAGNPAMTALLLGKDLSGLSAAPYRLDYAGGTAETLHSLPPVYIPPQPAPFVGGDLSAGIMAVAEHAPQYPYLLADLGTNGEFVLALTPQHALVTSVALGPALEGIGLTFGSVARPGVITRFILSPRGLEPVVMPFAPDSATPPSPPPGISGTGYLSLVRCLLRAGLAGRDGRFILPPRTPLGARLAASMKDNGGEQCLVLGSGLHISAGDIEEILKVKAAFTLAFARLLKEAGLAPQDLRCIYLAGALGEHVDLADLEELGFLPSGMGAAHPAQSGKVVGVGNASLRGAERFLVDPDLRAVAEVWSAATTHVDLTADPAFTQTFMRHMRFAHI
ncbi:ASKHA domain-containing protein [Desulfovibrio psychrotolerans]|uniref:(2Fe-2S)-binding protein n=1 Tax=Desulfovibrio psychrotolerans TaxID=415242 RepID=A0A7J0BVR8_9BACT|nr:ASKHA domain-containing protein [Desulfovibrio psychrotolerans]GFM37094.1 (2Fe-2S)-binding protein [Desulfovibrio psychrotolerans]